MESSRKEDEINEEEALREEEEEEINYAIFFFKERLAMSISSIIDAGDDIKKVLNGRCEEDEIRDFLESIPEETYFEVESYDGRYFQGLEGVVSDIIAFKNTHFAGDIWSSYSGPEIDDLYGLTKAFLNYLIEQKEK